MACMTHIPKILYEKENYKMHHVRIKFEPSALSVVMSSLFQLVSFVLFQI